MLMVGQAGGSVVGDGVGDVGRHPGGQTAEWSLDSFTEQ